MVPAGEYLLNGPIHFVSNVCLELQEGATLKFSSEPAFYLPLVKPVGKELSFRITVLLFMDISWKCFHHRQRSDRWKCGDYFCHLEK